MQQLQSTVLSALQLVLAFAFGACNGDQDTSQIPDVSVNFRIDVNDPLYIDLNPYGGYITLPNEGYRGIVVYHNFDDTYMAYDLSCTYEVSNPCARLEIVSNGFNLKCGETINGTFQDCCGSKFGWDGFPIDGPALYPLKLYNTTVTGSVVTITN
ncbi:MAG: hypothetical protein KDC92_03525 [Bacteroidetes bacterium]|nr:hypothetical protein [Bacteroidota bacterium]